MHGRSASTRRHRQGLAPAFYPCDQRFFSSCLMCSGGMSAYSVLTHEEIVDLLWTDEIQPLLLKRYPGLSEDQIREAHAYAYGGAVIQDLGYYPFGSEEFSNLVHYVRSGDFVHELLIESQDVNEYAFALGALSHYASDIAGHPAVNQSVAIEYPKLRAKFGKSVRYAQDKTAHLKTEFGFDTVQVAKNRYASQQYHDFIGFQVSKPLLERVFPVVYGVELKDVLHPRGSGGRLVSLRGQPDDSGNDPGRAANPQERPDARNARFRETKVSVSSFALRL